MYRFLSQHRRTLTDSREIEGEGEKRNAREKILKAHIPVAAWEIVVKEESTNNSDASKQTQRDGIFGCCVSNSRKKNSQRHNNVNRKKGQNKHWTGQMTQTFFVLLQLLQLDASPSTRDPECAAPFILQIPISLFFVQRVKSSSRVSIQIATLLTLAV